MGEESPETTLPQNRSFERNWLSDGFYRDEVGRQEDGTKYIKTNRELVVD